MGKKVSGLVVRGNTVLVSVITADTASTANYGIWRSTNGGLTFTRWPSGTARRPAYRRGWPTIWSTRPAPDTVYTCIALLTAPTGKGLFKSANLGATWMRVSTVAVETYITNVTSNIELAVRNSDNVYVGILESGALVAIFHSGDGGANWTPMDLPTMPIASANTFTVTNATNGSPIVITTSASHGYSTNQYVQITGVGGTPRPTGSTRFS